MFKTMSFKSYIVPSVFLFKWNAPSAPRKRGHVTRGPVLSTPDHAVSIPAAKKLISWTEASSTQLLKFGTVSPDHVCWNNFLIWGSGL